MTEINWNIEAVQEDVNVSLRETEMDKDYPVFFRRIFQTEKGAIGAEVECATMEGSTLWLKGTYGPSNGMMSLVKAAGTPDDIEGKTFVYRRVKSEKSPSGYAHSWKLD